MVCLAIGVSTPDATTALNSIPLHVANVLLVSSKYCLLTIPLSALVVVLMFNSGYVLMWLVRLYSLFVSTSVRRTRILNFWSDCSKSFRVSIRGVSNCVWSVMMLHCIVRLVAIVLHVDQLTRWISKAQCPWLTLPFSDTISFEGLMHSCLKFYNLHVCLICRVFNMF